jgi:enoyl-CoA hydratase/carnithine racemase
MTISSTRDGAIARIAFDRVEKRNAITAAMYQQMADAVVAAEQDPAVRVILFEGREGIFTAGNDLEDFLQAPPLDMDAPVFQFMRALSGAAKPVLAAVAGPAVGIGTTMLLHCDLVYAADNTRFALPFAQLGLCPEFGSSLLLPRVAGYQRAAEKLLFGEPFSAAEALEMGLVNKVLPLAELQGYAVQRAATLAALPASSLQQTKRLMKAGLARELPEVIAQEAQTFSQMLRAPEARQAFQAFLQRRKA